MTILITGNCGYIGSHVSRLFVEEGFDVAGLDNLSTGNTSNSIITTFIKDIRDINSLREVFDEYAKLGTPIDTVFHFAALTSVPESMEKRDLYFDVNVDGTENLLKVMKEYDCKRLIFSSTASVYQQSNEPVTEESPLQPLNNYAITKLEAEKLIKSQDWLQSIIFRYFNVIGFDDWYDKEIELSKTNIVPSLLKCIKDKTTFNVFGNCYPVKREDPNDKTCVRDYIDVRDIANAYIKAYNLLDTVDSSILFNLGTKTGSSVIEFIKAFEKANNIKLSYEIKEPRKGDPASVVADNKKAKELLGWSPEYSLEESLKLL